MINRKLILISLLICASIFVQYKKIENLKEFYKVKSINSYNIRKKELHSTINLYNKEIKYLNNEIEELQNTCSIDIQNLLLYIEPLKELNKQEYLIQYKNIISKYSDIFDAPETIYDYYTEEEINYMWKCIETETFQSDFNSKVNVACVILNRIDNKDFPLDPIEIITDKNQFAYGRDIITEDTKLALEYAFMIEDTTNGCIAFRSDISPDKWNGWSYQFTDDAGHHFYK